MMASLTKLATLFLALVFRREFLDSSSDLRPLYRFLSSHTPELLYRLPDFLHKERSWVLDANGLKNVLVRGGLGATSAIVAFSGRRRPCTALRSEVEIARSSARCLDRQKCFRARDRMATGSVFVLVCKQSYMTIFEHSSRFL